MFLLLTSIKSDILQVLNVKGILYGCLSFISRITEDDALTLFTYSGRFLLLMLKIRLQRVGRKNHAEFRVVVSEHQKTPTSGKNLEILGSYNPHTDAVTLVKDRIEYWMSVGAQPSGTVHNILINQNVIKGKKVNVLPKKTAPVKEEAPKKEAPVAKSPEATEESVPVEEVK